MIHMRDEKTITDSYNKVEFWGITVVYVLALFLLISDAITNGNQLEWGRNASEFHAAGVRYSLLANYTIPMAVSYSVLYLGYILLTLYVVPQIRKKNALVLHILLGLITFLAVGLALGICDTWIQGYKIPEMGLYAFHNAIFRERTIFSLWLLFLFVIYNVIKYFAIYLLSHEQEIRVRYPIITREGIIAAILWMISFFLLLLGNARGELIAVYTIIIPTAILLYWHSLHTLIPTVMPLQKRRFLRYAWKVLLLLLITAIPLGLLAYAMFFYGDPVAAIVLGNAAFQMFITVPVSWFAYKYKQQNSSEIKSLKIALGDKDAHLDMLRAQINPHFLFNSLNTLYGTALQEKADRTGEGIQKLGDMMRFMLTENMQDRIALNREIEYINNYISLQKLRTDISPNILIQTVLDDTPSGYHITPMLLIPFIENAFKHGISLREPSHIKISLSQKGGAIFFDVYNSKHTVNENDPERNNNGIGLANVRERLEVYYPHKHELIIRENDNEYFVHLTIQLD